MDYFPVEILFTKPSLIFLFRFHVNVEHDSGTRARAQALGHDLCAIINPCFFIHFMYLVTRNLEISCDIFFYCSLALFLGGPITFNEEICACVCFNCIHGLCTITSFHAD